MINRYDRLFLYRFYGSWSDYQITYIEKNNIVRNLNFINFIITLHSLQNTKYYTVHLLLWEYT